MAFLISNINVENQSSKRFIIINILIDTKFTIVDSLQILTRSREVSNNKIAFNR
ncbi:hypothetical protein TUA1478L_13590 [Lactiplantibacillus plantarum]